MYSFNPSSSSSSSISSPPPPPSSSSRSSSSSYGLRDSDNNLDKKELNDSKLNWADSGVCVDSGPCFEIPSTPILEDHDPFKQDSDGDTLLHLAIIQNYPELASNFIKEASSPHYLDITNDEFQTPLHLATITKEYNVMKQLISAGASLSISDRNGNTPLHLACKNGDLKAVETLLHRKSDHNIDLLNIKNYEGETCLHLATKTGHRSLIKYLVQSGVDVNAQEGKGGRTVLHYAAASGKSDLVSFLIQNCKCSPHIRSYSGITPMQILNGHDDSETDYYSDEDDSDDDRSLTNEGTNL